MTLIDLPSKLHFRYDYISPESIILPYIVIGQSKDSARILIVPKHLLLNPLCSHSLHSLYLDSI
jgi:hypothetical protein